MCNRNRLFKLTIVATMCMAYRLPLLALNPDTLLARASGPDSLLTRSYDFVSRSDGWFRTHNAAALTRFRSDNISQAELTVSHAHGGMVDYYQSPSTLNVTAAVQSLSRISRRTVVYGAISYDNFSGKHMTGSAFIDPTRKPFDIVEDSLTNPGRKHRDTYHLTGGVGIDLYKGIALGLRADYLAANYAKYKDLRHKNKLMDMTFTASVYVPVGSWLALGAGYEYRRTTESVTFSTYGKNDKVFKSLISYGPHFGHVEQFASNGYTDQSRTMPLVDDYNGFTAQLWVSPVAALTWLNSFSYAYRHGYYGRKSPYTITYSGHTSRSYTFQSQLMLRLSSSRHTLSADVSVENLENRQSVYREMKNESGASYYEYYTPVRTGNRLWMEGQVSYTADLGVRGELPCWTVQAALQWYHRHQTAFLYPYYRRQRIGNRDYSLSVERNFLLPKGVLTVNLHGSLRKGIGSLADDGTLAEPSEKQEFPPTMEAFLCREYQYLAASGYSVGGRCRYAFLLPGIKLRPHVELSVDQRKANVTFDYSQGCDNTTLSLTVGCIF